MRKLLNTLKMYSYNDNGIIKKTIEKNLIKN